ncbi:hypothetical protein [Microbacterium sp.]|uniref:hypothetical protein n=1 Tax=Microbacterium sp. TaxID=51671 RepID=UPI003A949C08
MSTLWKRALATTTIALVAGFGMTACSTGDNGSTTTKTTQSQTEQAPKASGVMTADDFTQRMNDAQYKAGSAHFTQSTEVSGQKLETSGDMVLNKDAAKMRMSMSMPGGMEIRIVDGEVYMNLGQLTENKFFKAPKDGSNPIFAQLDQSLSQADLGKQLEVFRAALKDFKADEGADTIDGVKTTKYTLTLDTKKMLASSATEVPAEALKQLGDTVTYELYAGPDDLPRRMVMNMAGTAMTMDFSQWGSAAEVTAPSADQITDKAPAGL